MPRAPEAEPHTPAMTVVPTATPSSGGPGMLTMALVMEGNAAEAATTVPKATTAQVLQMDTIADLQASPTLCSALWLS
ncbi:hypothetical protein SDC9_64845 [bioreactor metagenome]|uniref:Uncharacterized protein n=1 Tax=bioreactor metagenome TaxID=1076179 RepID=A0A644XWK4_9ZZZZ